MAGAAVHDPLLPPRPGSAAEDGQWGLAATETKRLLRLAGPIVASYTLQNLITMVSIMFVGHLGELPLAGASLATSVANVTGYSFLTGMATALETLCGQAFGAGQHHMLGLYKQRAMVVLALVCVPVALVWAYTGQILVFLGQRPDIAAEAGSYAQWLIPSLVAYAPLQCHIEFLQTQGIVLPVLASSGATVLCHVALCWTLVYKAGMGSKGAALSNAISYGLNLVALSTYVRRSSACKTTWTGFSREAFSELPRFAKLAVPAAMMLCLEWWSSEILVLLSGLLPNPQLETSVLSVCVNFGTLLFMIPYGLGASVSYRVSNELGAGRPQAAKLAIRVVLCMALSEGLVIGLTMILLRSVLGYVYSVEQEVVAYISKLMPVFAISFFTDGLHYSLSGVLTGCGMQNIGAAVNFVAFYLAGIPIAVVLAFIFHLNAIGLWLGTACGGLVKLLMMLAFVTWFIDWEKQVFKAKDRVFGSSLPTE